MDEPFFNSHLRALPQVQRLLELPEAQALLRIFPRHAVVAAFRDTLDEARHALRSGYVDQTTASDLVARAQQNLAAAALPHLRAVINATGIILHTNLGRAPLPQAAIAAIAAAGGYCNLEFDLARGERGSRTAGIETLLRRLTGAEAGIAVNNCAAAVLLALSALSEGGEVLVSRGELVEIGGGFRIPDVIQQGGARLVEVGTTNKTRLADYRRAITPATRILLKVHQSNFRITGFTEEAPLAELATLAAETGLTLVHDLGSGAATDLQARIGRPEPTVQSSVSAGADVVAFSGDKLLGGPQSGLLVGREMAIDRLRRHPLLRALRLDKLCLAALEATLRLHCDADREAIPVLRQIHQPLEVLATRAASLVALLGPAARAEPSQGYTGGGTLPDIPIASHAVRLHLSAPPAATLAARLRAGHPPVIGRIDDGDVVFDMLTLTDAELPDLARVVRKACSE